MATVRESIPADTESVVGVIRRSISELCLKDHRNRPSVLNSWLANKNTERVSAWIADAGCYCATALDQSNEVVGFAMLSREGELQLLYISPDQVGTGLGQSLLKEMEDQAVSWGLAEISLDSTITAKEFYQRHGYVYRGSSQPRADRMSCKSLFKILNGQMPLA